ncbi:MAG: hypothetical protein JNK05_07470 [Myxococcales bacterium]|nr:hypothetical protein [Myxococcales bacterium]
MIRPVITLDIDWAPDVAIDFAADLLATAGAKATWFVTHASPAVDRLRQRPDLFELGIHPNFLPRSSHGTTPEEVLDYCMKLVPDAVSMRTHSLVQSTPLLATVLARTPVRCDATMLLSHAKRTEPFEYQWGGTTMLRVPYHWEDDIEMIRDVPKFSLDDAIAGEGLRVFDFHPIHVFLNSADMKPYEGLKSAVKPLNEATLEAMQPFVYNGAGSRTVFEALAKYAGAHGGGERIGDIYNAWKAGR